MSNGLKDKSVTLELKAGITAVEIDTLLKKIYAEAGCPACGLAGFDLKFKINEEPVYERLNLASLATVRSISVLPRESFNRDINIREAIREVVAR
ncbi:MAG: hypothetical protein QOH21_696 [Acidobacteriota bacterium]|jgi:hypothetical protein|nr:hypothetical protein [Acidobacteriota bacterium]